jgi:UDP-N-acetylglucosamine diphosphorylase / glucose-1-phosphate thymidylyltransferase / UDP-N-acetylgalactosamine diphosphorylase / glucosamine-1-phosphate N-acetyltransferase / galactosamine-1-phosphate N-acetyltransferase
MSAVYLYDDARARRFEPFALTRPAGELRAGALLMRERWERALGMPVAGHVTSEQLVGFEEPGAAPVLTEGVIPAGSWVVNSRFAPAPHATPRGEVLLADNRVAALKAGVPVQVAALRDGTATLDQFASRVARQTSAVHGWWMDAVWDYVAYLVPMLELDIPALGAGPAMSQATPAGSIRIGEHGLFIEAGAVVEPQVCFDLTAGPVLLRAGSHVQAFTRLVGPVYVGAGSTVTTDRIAASSIGDVCKVHGEVSNTIFIGHANKGHDGFVGHSILGRWVNLGAGTITSNLKNTYGTVQLWTPDGMQETGLQFLGTMFGDHAKTGIGLRLTTGTVIGAGANVYGSVMPPKAVAPFGWGEAGSLSAYRVEKFLEVAERMMARRHVTLGEGARRQLLASYEHRWRFDA